MKITNLKHNEDILTKKINRERDREILTKKENKIHKDIMGITKYYVASHML